MRKIVFQMMTSLDGRLDDPMSWVHGVSDDQYRDIDEVYATFDTVLVGRITNEEMASYWPVALAERQGTDINQSMARRMNEYRKLVFTRSEDGEVTGWNNAERVVVGSDEELARYLTALKAKPGGDLHLSGGASFAQSVVRLGLVDEFYFFVYPIVSPGASWFAGLVDPRELALLDARSYENGVVRLRYVPRPPEARAEPESFSDLLI